MKYIMLEDKNGIKHPVIFPDFFVHAIIARAVIDEFRLRKMNLKVTSAGFVDSLDLNVNCTGKSESLNVESDNMDSFEIKYWDYFKGMSRAIPKSTRDKIIDALNKGEHQDENEEHF